MILLYFIFIVLVVFLTLIDAVLTLIVREHDHMAKNHAASFQWRYHRHTAGTASTKEFRFALWWLKSV